MNKNILRTAAALGLSTAFLAGCGKDLNQANYTLAPDTNSYTKIGNSFLRNNTASKKIQLLRNEILWRVNSGRQSTYNAPALVANHYGEITILTDIPYKKLTEPVQWQARVFPSPTSSELVQNVTVTRAGDDLHSNLPLQYRNDTVYDITFGNYYQGDAISRSSSYTKVRPGSTIFVEAVNPNNAQPIPKTSVIFSIG